MTAPAARSHRNASKLSEFAAGLLSYGGGLLGVAVGILLLLNAQPISGLGASVPVVVGIATGLFGLLLATESLVPSVRLSRRRAASVIVLVVLSATAVWWFYFVVQGGPGISAVPPPAPITNSTS
jgi:hypothetical protein